MLDKLTADNAIRDASTAKWAAGNLADTAISDEFDVDPLSLSLSLLDS